MDLLAIDHVQVAMPPGGEGQARQFYAGVLGLTEAAKPKVLTARGGAWFESGAVRIHLGVEEGFRPARKAHPAIRVSDLGALRERLQDAGFDTRDGERLGDVERFYVEDPFGNRLEFLQVLKT